MAKLSSCQRWNGHYLSILALWCACAWSIQIVHGQGGGAGAVDNPTLAPSPGGNPTTPGSPGEAAPPPPPADPSAPQPPLGGGGGLSQPVGSTFPTVTTGLVLPTVMFIPGTSGVDMNATAPYFPSKSVSCQQCRYFYPKLVECNMIANQTLSLIPRLGEPRTNSSITTEGPGAMPLSKERSPLLIRSDQERGEDCGWDGGPGMESIMALISKFGLASNPGSATSTLSDPTGSGNGNLGPGGATTSSAPGTGNGQGSGNGSGSGDGPSGASSDQHGQGGETTPAPSGIDFTSIMPFLQCICPNQGLAAAKVCLTCFRVSNQRNFLDGLTQQNVTTSLATFAEACADSHDGARIPPSNTRGQSASRVTNGVGRQVFELTAIASLAGVLGASLLLQS